MMETSQGASEIVAASDPYWVGVARAGEFLRLRVEDAFRRYAFHACRDTRVLLATLGNDAGIYGCARLAMGG